MANITSRERTMKLVQMAMLSAIIILMAFTPLGYLKVGTLSITFIMIPVVIGAIVLGPSYGAILGGLFGITSFIQCFGLEPFGTALFSINPFYTFIICMVPRILMGFLAGLIFKAIARIDKTKVLSFVCASLSGALLNTILFMGSLVLLFGNTDYIHGFMDMLGTTSVIPFIIAFVGVNGLVEAITCCVVGFAVSKALVKFVPSNRTQIEAK